jgi:hypothetical protein
MTVWRLIIALAIGLIVLYWVAVVAVRSVLGLYLPDPADLFPAEWRGYLP